MSWPRKNGNGTFKIYAVQGRHNWSLAAANYGLNDFATATIAEVTDAEQHDHGRRKRGL